MEREFVSKKILKKVLKERRKDTHKGENGRLLIIGGSIEYIGSPILACLSALKFIDLVEVFAPEKAALAMNALSPDIITKKFPGNYLEKKHIKRILKETKKFDSVLIGNGLGQNKKTREFVNELIPRIKTKKIIDADAIKLLSGKTKNALFLPHAVEFKEYFKEKIPAKLNERIKLNEKKAKEFETTILLKGRIDIISNNEKTLLNKTGNPRMAVIGTGDVLAGIVAALSTKNPLFESACAGAFINGLLGEKAFQKKGNYFTATDLIELIPETLKKVN
jgi:NAD(P)H-hydrate epimerase